MHQYFEISKADITVRCKAYYNDRSLIRKAIVFCTGFAGHKDNGTAEKFADKLLSEHDDAEVIVFNWPAHGDDAKKILDLQDCNSYLDILTDELKKRDISELYAYATSFGGYLILKYLSEHEDPFVRIALRCPAIDMYGVLTRNIMKENEYERIMQGEKVEVGFDRKIIVTDKLLHDLQSNDIRQRNYRNYARKMLVIHGDVDEVAPFADSETFTKNNNIPFLPVKGADHRFQDPVLLTYAHNEVIRFLDL